MLGTAYREGAGYGTTEMPMVHRFLPFGKKVCPRTDFGVSRLLNTPSWLSFHILSLKLTFIPGIENQLNVFFFILFFYRCFAPCYESSYS